MINNSPNTIATYTKDHSHKSSSRKKRSLWLGLAMLFVLLVGAAAGLFLTQNNQDIRQQAAEYTCESVGNTCVTGLNKSCTEIGGLLNASGNCNQGFCCSGTPTDEGKGDGDDGGIDIITPKPEDEASCNEERCQRKGYRWYWNKNLQDCKVRADNTCTGEGSDPLNSGPVTDIWCDACGGFYLSQEEEGQGWGCNTASFQRCGEYPDSRGGGDVTDQKASCGTNSCTGSNTCTVYKYQCDRNTNLGSGCQENFIEASKGTLSFSASCGAEQIDVTCKDGSKDHISRTYTTACTEDPTPTPTPTPTPQIVCDLNPNLPEGCYYENVSCTLQIGSGPCCPVLVCVTPTPIGPQCHDIQIFSADSETPLLLSADDDNDFIPGETTVRFVCSADQDLITGYHYEFRVWEPCGSTSHDSSLQFNPGGSSLDYDITLAGDYAVQCAVCKDGAGDVGCDWEAYTPSVCN